MEEYAMKKNLLPVMLAALMVLVFACSATADGKNLTIINQTGVDIYQLYMSPSGSEDWEEDLLEGEVFENGTELVIEFEDIDGGLWDLLIMDKAGNSLEWYQLDLGVISRLTLYFDGERAWAEA